MFKRILKNHGLTVVTIGLLVIPFLTGFACGRGANEERARNEIAAAAEEEAEYTPLEVEATAYCDCFKCCGKTDGITATGTKATAGRTIAVDPSVIPYGAEVIINGHTYIAEDCGSAVKGNAIGIFHETHEAARQFGRQRLTVLVKN